MSNKILSIVVPSYNAANYLEETIPTMAEVANPSMLEIIIVNDGSKDNTSEVAAKLANKYPETVRVLNKENGGHGSTINAGIVTAEGKYFKVVDADDWIMTDNLSDLLDYLQTTDDDQIISPYYKFYEDTNTETLEQYNVSRSNYSYDYVAFLKEVKSIPLMHSITIKTSILKENSILIDENCFYVDLEYNTFPMPYINTISYFNKPIYRYRLGRPGQSVSMQSYIKNIKMHEKVCFSLINFYNNYKNKSRVEEEYLSILIQDIISIHAKIYLSMPYSKKVKLDFIKYENHIASLNPYFVKNSRGKKLTLLRSSRYYLFYLLSLVSKK